MAWLLRARSPRDIACLSQLPHFSYDCMYVVRRESKRHGGRLFQVKIEKWVKKTMRWVSGRAQVCNLLVTSLMVVCARTTDACVMGRKSRLPSYSTPSLSLLIKGQW